MGVQVFSNGNSLWKENHSLSCVLNYQVICFYSHSVNPENQWEDKYWYGWLYFYNHASLHQASLLCSQTLIFQQNLGFLLTLVSNYMNHNQYPLVGGLCFPDVLSMLTTWRATAAALDLREQLQKHLYDTSDPFTMPAQ